MWCGLHSSAVSYGDLGVLEFQLYVLESMRPPESFLAPALAALGRTGPEMLDASEAVGAAIRPMTGSPRRITEILSGARWDMPSLEGPHISVYALPLWPDFYFHVELMAEADWIWCAEFRRHGARKPADRVAPWEFVRSDLADAFDAVEEVDLWSPYGSYSAHDRESGRRYFLRFGWGLLQEMEAYR